MPTVNHYAHFDGLTQPQKLRAKGKVIYVADFGGNRIALIDYEGSFLGEVGAGFLTQPTGVTLIGDDVVAIHSPRRLRRFNPSGALVNSVTVPASTQPQVPTHLPVTGETVITEFANNRLICLDSRFDLINTLGSGVTGVPNPTPVDFYQPKDVLYVEDRQIGPSLYVADSANKRVLRIQLNPPDSVGKMTLDGTNTTEFTQGRVPAGGQPFKPIGLAYEPQNEVAFCVDGSGGDIWMIDVRAGSVSRIYANFGTGPGQLMNPSGIEVVADEFLAVSDWGTNRVTIFRIS